MRRSKRKEAILLLSLAVFVAATTVVAYWPVNQNGFINYDDYQYVTENPAMHAVMHQGLSWDSVKWAFTTRTQANWHPLTWLSHMVDCRLFGLNARGHHWMNISGHILNSILVILVLYFLTGQVWLGGVVGILFALHPLHVESAAWAAERKDVLSTFFALLSMLAYVWYARKGGLVRYLAVFVLFGLGLLAKPMVVTLPFVFLLLDVWPLGRWGAGAAGTDKTGGNRLREMGTGPSENWLLLEKVPLFAMSAASCFVTFVAQRGWGATASINSVPIKARLLNTFSSYVIYIRDVFWPMNLGFMYPHMKENQPVWLGICGALIVMAVLAFAVWNWRRRGYLFTGWLWYLGMLVPVIGLVQVGQQSRADRYMYLPSIGLFVVLVWGGRELVWRRLSAADEGVRRLVVGTAVVLVTGLMIVGTQRQVGYWKDNVTFFERSLAVTKNNFIIENSLGLDFLQQGRYEEALVHLDRSIEIRPLYFDSNLHRGIALLSLKRFDEAIQVFSMLVDSKDKAFEVCDYLAQCYAGKEDYAKAIEWYERALQEKPDYMTALNNLAMVYTQQGQDEQARPYLQRAITIQPRYSVGYYNLGLLEARQGNFQEAIRNFQEVLRYQPGWAEVEYNLGAAYIRLGDREKAVEHCRKALEYNPNYHKAMVSLGRTLYDMGQFDQAIEYYEKAVADDATDSVAVLDLAWLLATSTGPEHRNAARSIELVSAFCQGPGRDNPHAWDVLGAAYAAGGEYDKAAEAASKALEMGENMQNTKRWGQIQARLALYRQGKPYFEE